MDQFENIFEERVWDSGINWIQVKEGKWLLLCGLTFDRGQAFSWKWWVHRTVKKSWGFTGQNGKPLKVCELRKDMRCWDHYGKWGAGNGREEPGQKLAEASVQLAVRGPSHVIGSPETSRDPWLKVCWSSTARGQPLLLPSSVEVLIIKFKKIFFIFFWEKGREALICCTTYFFIHWLILVLVCALTRDWTWNPSKLRWGSNELSCRPGLVQTSEGFLQGCCSVWLGTCCLLKWRELSEGTQRHCQKQAGECGWKEDWK